MVINLTKVEAVFHKIINGTSGHHTLKEVLILKINQVRIILIRFFEDQNGKKLQMNNLMRCLKIYLLLNEHSINLCFISSTYKLFTFEVIFYFLFSSWNVLAVRVCFIGNLYYEYGVTFLYYGIMLNYFLLYLC